ERTVAMSITCRRLSDAEFPQALAIRWRVFVDEQHVPPELEQDEYDQTAVHFGAFDHGQMVGTGRIVIHGEKGKIGRLAVLKPYRGRGIGMQLLEAMVGYLTELGLSEAYLGAQIQAVGFYEKAGFAAEGELFDDAGIPHRMMRKKLKK
ncbi:MAG: GNAT family N-acetyltransferase, partial [Limnochordia bacterium]